MVVDGLGVARVLAIMDKRGEVSKEHLILIVLATVEFGRVFMSNCELTG